jgi:hypothetical protein
MGFRSTLRDLRIQLLNSETFCVLTATVKTAKKQCVCVTVFYLCISPWQKSLILQRA